MKSFVKFFSVAAVGLTAACSFAQWGPHSPLVGKDVRHFLKGFKFSRRSYAGRTGTAIVLYDTTSDFGWAGDLYGQQLANLLTHFDLKVTMMPVEKYTKGTLAKYGSAFYLGYVFDNPLSADFKADVMAYNKPFCWSGFNIWQIAWKDGVYQGHDPAFLARTGIRFMGLDDSGYPTVNYKGQDLVKEQDAKTEGRVELDDPTKATVIAISTSPEGASIPYITKGASQFWYVADNPMMGMSLRTMQDRVLAFDDVLHDIVGVKHTEKHRAFIRIEDVSPLTPPDKLREIADVCGAAKIPFEVCVIPVLEDPLGAYFNGISTEIPMTQAPDFVKALHYMETKGGQIIMHGLTHQYSNLPNPYDGASADDFEFFRVTTDSIGRIVMLGPVAEDSRDWAMRRVLTGRLLLLLCGFYVTGWNTPHYTASPIDYDVFAENFDYSLCRSLTYSQDTNGVGHYLTQFSPFTYTDDHGMFRIPETIGYVDPTGFADVLPNLPVDMQARAHANLVVRDGWAGSYFHPFLPTSYLKELIDRIKSEGYTYVKTSKNVDN